MTTTLRAIVKRNIRFLKARSGKRWVDVAEAIGVTERQVYRWSRDQEPVTPNDENLVQLARYFDVTAGWFLEDHKETRRA